MSVFPNIAATAHLMADPTRSAMLVMLMDGRAYPAGVLARAAGVTAQTASAHLGKLREGGLVRMQVQGRHRYYSLANAQVAQALEGLAMIRPPRMERALALSPQQQRLQFCRRCYDHLAGQVGVAVTDVLLERDYLQPDDGRRYTVTPQGAHWFAQQGVRLEDVRPGSKGVARSCPDWTERRPHLAGPLGMYFMRLLCDRGWLRREPDSRAVQVTPDGRAGFRRILGLELNPAGQEFLEPRPVQPDGRSDASG